ncbi:type II toxin-antitoxin system RelE/ParE family toxin [bacterium]|nr:MAG: type II toxin-antitoxin system RelE/ParE family toxin [bacterium]
MREADRYNEFLQWGLENLLEEPEQGQEIAEHRGLRRLTLRLRSGGHGHIVVHRVDTSEQTIRILRIFHTAQDWQQKL